MLIDDVSSENSTILEAFDKINYETKITDKYTVQPKKSLLSNNCENLLSLLIF